MLKLCSCARLLGLTLVTFATGNKVWALSSPETRHRIAIVGGGTSGMFAAACVTKALGNHDSVSLVDVKLYESTDEVLRNVRSSHQGGILDDTSKSPRELINAGYPRGKKEITSLLTKSFPPLKQQKWFEDHGIQFKTKQDGTMVSEEETSDGILDAILRGGVCEVVETKARITSITVDSGTNGFQLTINGNRAEKFDSVILATGNSHLGHKLATSLGHTIGKRVRSCFAFKLKGGASLSFLQEGVSCLVPYARLSFKVKVKGQKRPRVFKSEGSACFDLVNGVAILSGKAAISLSSLAAIELRGAAYEGLISVHYCPDHMGGKVEKLEEYLWQYRQDHPREVVGERCPLSHQYVDYDDYDWETESFKTVTNDCIPRDLWQGLAEVCGASFGSLWSKMSPKKVRQLAEIIVGCPFEFDGRDTSFSGSLFINTGGILLNEIDMSTMKSKVVGDGLFCCGQIMDGDASHSSFSFMRDFASGKVAGESAAAYALGSIHASTDE